MIQSRRAFLRGAGAVLITAPAIVRAASLMPVKAMSTHEELMALLYARMRECERLTREMMNRNLYGDLCDITRQAFVPRLFTQIYAHSPLEMLVTSAPASD